MKIEGEITRDKNKIEAKVLKYFGALLNGHHDPNDEDIGHPFVPDNTDLPDFLNNLVKLSQNSQDNLIKNLTLEQVKFVVFKKCDRTKFLGLMDYLINFTRSPGL